MTRDGHFVVGPPGCGKSAYCRAMRELLTLLKRSVVVVNLDPANDKLCYKCDIDIQELVTVDDVMEEFELGPNGGMVRSMEYLRDNFSWLKERLSCIDDKCTVLFDCPGQVELFSDHTVIRDIIHSLCNDSELGINISVVQLVDSQYCCDPYKYLSTVLLCLSVMLRLELPFVNVFSKMDLAPVDGSFGFRLDYFLEAEGLSCLPSVMSELSRGPLQGKFKELNERISEVIEEFCLVSFTGLSINDNESVLKILQQVDRCVGRLGEKYVIEE